MAIIETTLTVKYDANGGSGTPASQTNSVIGNSYPIYNTITLRSTAPTREGYNFVGWATSPLGTAQYSPGGAYTYAFAGQTTHTTTLYAVWSKQAPQNSTIESLSPSAPIDGQSSRTLQIRRKNNSYLHRVELTYGTKTEVYQSVGQGQSGNIVTLTFAIPTTWLSEIPNATSAVATCTVKTFSGSTMIGSPVSKTFTITVPESVKPTAALSGVNQSSNSAVSGWGILVKGYSTIKLTATAQAGAGASIASIAFSGDGVNQTGTGTTVTSNTLTTAGSRQWKVVVTDTRGRTATATLTRTVYDYAKPSGSLLAFRSDNTGAASDAEGTYITAKATFTCASCNNRNTVTAKISYKQHTASSWSTGQNSAATNTLYTFGGGNISVLYPYDVKVEITDAVGNKTTISGTVPNVKGISFGLNGESARFGGPILHDDRFECDWPILSHGDVTVEKSSGTTGLFVERTDTGKRIGFVIGANGDNHGVYSYTDGKWLIYDDSTGKTRIPDTLYLAQPPMILGHGTALGTIVQKDLASNTTIATATNKAILSIQLYAGTWIIVARARFSANANGYRHINISSTSADNGVHIQVPAVNGAVTQLALTRIVSISATTTFYMNAYQNSGSTLTMAAGSGGEINALTAIRIL